MTARWLIATMLFTCIAASGLRAQQLPKQAPERSSAGRIGAPRLKLRTNAFKDDARLPLKYTCWAADDQVVSPPFQWSYTPKPTQSFALYVFGPENLHGSLLSTFHWLRWNIPPSTTE